jgi:hypothetical protein
MKYTSQKSRIDRSKERSIFKICERRSDASILHLSEVYLNLIFLFLLFCCVDVKRNQGVQNELSKIEIASTNSIEEAEAYDRLSDLLIQKGQAIYDLKFSIEYTENTLAISRFSDILRKGLTQTLKFELSDKITNQVLLKDTIKTHSSYSLISEPLVSYAQMESNKKFLARRGAENLRYRLMIFFNNTNLRSK